MYEAFGKRLLDILLALTAVLLLLPLIMVVAISIKFGDPGLVIFKQVRVGRHGQKFVFYKFRSMPVHTGDIPSDQIGRIQTSRVGRIIRRTNIDELPQLFNILKGDMSIVGPRPPIPGQIELLGARTKNGALACRPGLTGLAQVSSFDGMSAAEKAAFDGQYAQRITFLGDLNIIFRTFAYLLKPPPVY